MAGLRLLISSLKYLPIGNMPRYHVRPSSRRISSKRSFLFPLTLLKTHRYNAESYMQSALLHMATLKSF